MQGHIFHSLSNILKKVGASIMDYWCINCCVGIVVLGKKIKENIGMKKKLWGKVFKINKFLSNNGAITTNGRKISGGKFN